MFSREFCKISKNTFSHRTPPVAASHLFWLLYRNTFCRTYFLRTSLFGWLFYCQLFFFVVVVVVNWIVSLSIFLISLAAVYRGSAIKLFLRITQISLENNCAGVFFHRFEGLESPAAILWRNRHHRRCFSVNFAKCTYKAAPRDWFCTLLQVDFKFISHFSATIIVFEIFYQTQ